MYEEIVKEVFVVVKTMTFLEGLAFSFRAFVMILVCLMPFVVAGLVYKIGKKWIDKNL